MLCESVLLQAVVHSFLRFSLVAIDVLIRLQLSQRNLQSSSFRCKVNRNEAINVQKSYVLFLITFSYQKCPSSSSSSYCPTYPCWSSKVLQVAWHSHRPQVPASAHHWTLHRLSLEYRQCSLKRYWKRWNWVAEEIAGKRLRVEAADVDEVEMGLDLHCIQ